MSLVLNFLLYCLKDIFSVIRDIWIRVLWKERNVHLARGVYIYSHSRGAVKFGDGVNIGRGSLILATTEKSALSTSQSFLHVGPGTAINEYCNIRASGGHIIIGTKCMLAQFVTIVASNHGVSPNEFMIDQLWSTKQISVEIGDDVWVGANAVILPGVKIGNGSVIAAGAVVSSDVPEYEIWGGVPARRLKARC